MPSNDSKDSNLTWGQRHGLTVIVAIMAVSFVLVIVVQVLS